MNVQLIFLFLKILCQDVFQRLLSLSKILNHCKHYLSNLEDNISVINDIINLLILYQIDGTFRVDAPPVLLGYTQQRTMEGELDIGVARDNRTLLGMFITIEPPLTQAEPMKEKVSRLFYLWKF